MRTTTLILLLSIALGAQQRDTPVVATAAASGTSEISGVVVSGDTRQPLRRVVVTVTSDQLPAPRSVITDDAGRFVFTRLPAGLYAITAKKAAYLATAFESPKPGRPGSRVALGAGEKRATTLTMFRGGAISGTLRNADGTAAAGVLVEVLNARLIGQPDPDGPDLATTNDRGEFRVYGLMPGDYIVLASPAHGGSGEIGARTPAEMNAVLAALTQRQAGMSAGTQPAPSPAPLAYGKSVSYAMVYYPGTTNLADAERIRVAAGDDRAADFSIMRVPVASIEGAITGDVPSLAAAQIAIVPEFRIRFGAGPGAGITMTGVPPNERGEFRYGNLSPGTYRIVARAHRAAPAEPPLDAATGLRRPPTGDGGGETLYAVADVEMRGEDITGLTLALEPGGSVSGQVVFDSGGTPIPTDVSRIRLGATMVGMNNMTFYQVPGLRVGNMLSDVPPVGLQPDGTFRITGVGPAAYSISFTLPNDMTKVWKLRSAVVDGRDLLDVNFTGPRVDLRGVMVTLSDKRTEISGSLLSATGQPVNEYYVIAFSADRAHWRAGARRSVSARPATNGRYVFNDLPPGDYLIAALTDLDPNEWQEPAFLSQVAPSAIRITLAEGQTKSQDLRIK